MLVPAHWYVNKENCVFLQSHQRLPNESGQPDAILSLHSEIKISTPFVTYIR